MHNHKNFIGFLSLLFTLLICSSASATVTIQSTQGWFESGCVCWTVEQGEAYTVYIRPEGGEYTKLDNELVRNYGTYGRADMVGLKAGKYQFKVVAGNGDSAESGVFTAVAHDRSGFAHVGMDDGIGAYKNDGTLKNGAKVIYVYANNAKTVTTDVKTNAKGGTTKAVGFQDIIYLYQKGYDTTPLDIRIIGTIKASDMDSFGSSAEGLQIKGNNEYAEMPITIEGIGNDANIWGFGILVRNCKDTEFRNFGIMLCKDDCLSLDTGNSNVWIHNMDFFYGQKGSAADQVKGDGTLDVKAKSKNITASYNHFFDSGKSSLGGMKSETTDCWLTYHHNWFDHSDSRHPRIRTMFFHIYNNYFDGNSKYGVGVTMGGSAFVEQNYFRNCKYPMLISKQGTDAQGAGTFSGEAGGVIKAYDNHITGAKQVLYYDGTQTDGKWDAVLVSSRDEAIGAIAYNGGTSYNSTADEAARSSYIENNIDDKENVASVCRGEYAGREGLGAGRMNGGDFHWTFDNSVQDANYDIITELKSALESYKSTLVGFFYDVTTIENGGSTDPVDSGDTDKKGDTSDVTPSWGDDTSDDGKDNNELTNDVVCYFIQSSKTASSSMVTVDGNYSNSKGSVTYDSKSYGDCVKMESATSILIQPTADCTITLIFGGTTAAGGKKIKLDDEKITLDTNGKYTFAAKAGTTYTLKKGDSINLFLIIFVPTNDATAVETVKSGCANAINSAKTYTLSGVETSSSAAQKVIIRNGRKTIAPARGK